MAKIVVEGKNIVFQEENEIQNFLKKYNIWYKRFSLLNTLNSNCTNEEILQFFKEPIQEQMEIGGYVTADVVNLNSSTPNIDVILEKFDKEHWHEEDEVRFIVKGRGVFYINPKTEPIFKIEVEKGDMINVPKGTYHWFILTKEKEIQAVRLFKDQSGWTPYYTKSQVENTVSSY